jgi:hypothetical protein
MSDGWTPPLTVRKVGRRCRLSLDGVTWGDGDTLQEAADDLVSRLLAIALALRSNGWNLPSELGPPDLRVLSFLWELGEIAAGGDDIRDRVFGFAGDRV